MSRNKQKILNPFYDPAARDAFNYLLRRVNRLEESSRRDKNNIARLNEIVSMKFKVRHFEEEPEVAE